MIHYIIEFLIGSLLFIFNALDTSNTGISTTIYSNQKILLLITHLLVILVLIFIGFFNKFNIPKKIKLLILKTISKSSYLFIFIILFTINYWTFFIWIFNYKGLNSYWYYFENLLPLFLWFGLSLIHFLVYSFSIYAKNNNLQINKNFLNNFTKVYSTKNFIFYFFISFIFLIIFGNTKFKVNYEFIYTISTPFTLFETFPLIIITYISISLYLFFLSSKNIYLNNNKNFITFSFIGMIFFGQTLRFSENHFLTMQKLLFIFDLKPIFYFCFLLCFSFFISSLIINTIGNNQFKIIKDNKKIYFWSILIVVLIIIIIKLFNFIYEPDDRFWNGAGNPILFSQISIGICITLLISFFYKCINNKKYRNKIFPILSIITIIILCIINWQWKPDYRNYFVNEPIKPNMEYYPYSDAQDFDWGGQYLEEGFGIKNYDSTANAFTMFLTHIYHIFSGDDYIKTYKIQMIIMFLFPVGIFALGYKLGSKEFGLLIAILIVFQEGNAIRLSGEISNVHIQLLMSEIPSMLLILWGIIFFISAIKSQDDLDYILSGLIFGFASLCRLNPIFIVGGFGIILIILLLKQKILFKKLLYFSSSFSLIFFGWYTSIFLITGNIVFIDKIKSVLNRTNATFDSGNLLLLKINPLKDLLNEGIKIIYALTNHFFHNIINTFLVLPMNFKISNPINVNSINYKFWDPFSPWTGDLSIFEIVFILINLFLIINGINQLYKKNGWIALIPLLSLFFYSVSLGAARTSGGRYITPINWIFVFYYSAGLWNIFTLIFTEFKSNNKKKKKLNKKHINTTKFILIGTLLITFIWMIISPFVTPKRQILTENEIKNIFEEIYDENNISNGFNNGKLNFTQELVFLDTISLYPVIDKEYLLSAKIIDANYKKIIFPVKNDNNLKMPHKENIFLIGYPNKNEIIVMEYAYQNEFNQWFYFSADTNRINELIK